MKSRNFNQTPSCSRFDASPVVTSRNVGFPGHPGLILSIPRATGEQRGRRVSAFPPRLSCRPHPTATSASRFPHSPWPRESAMGPWLCILGALPSLRCPLSTLPVPCLLPKGAPPGAEPPPCSSLPPLPAAPEPGAASTGLFLRSRAPRSHAGAPHAGRGAMPAPPGPQSLPQQDTKEAMPGTAALRKPKPVSGREGEERRGGSSAYQEPSRGSRSPTRPQSSHRPLGTGGTHSAPTLSPALSSQSWYPEGLRTLLEALPRRLG